MLRVLNRSKQPYFTSDGRECVGVTTVLQGLDKSALMRWAAGLERNHTAALVRSGLELDGPLAFELARDTAADTGTLAHAMIEAELCGDTLDTEGMDPEQVAMANGGKARFFRWWEDSGFKLVACEHRMVDESLRLGGTADILATNPGGQEVLIDGKSSRSIYMAHKVQVAQYARMRERETGTLPRSVIVRFGKGGGAFVPERDTHWLTAREHDAGEKMFAALLTIYRERAVFGE